MSKPTTITLDKLQETNAGLVLSGQIAIIDDLHINQMPQQAQLEDCSLLWLCEAGSARYVCDTKDYVTGPNDFSIISREQIIGGIHANKDFKGVGMVISQDFFSEVIQNVHELASIFMFARTHPVSHLLDTEADTFKDYHQRIKQKIQTTCFAQPLSSRSSPRWSTTWAMPSSAYRKGDSLSKATRAPRPYSSILSSFSQHISERSVTLDGTARRCISLRNISSRW